MTYEASLEFTINDTINAVLLIDSPNREDGEQITGRLTAVDTLDQSEASVEINIINVNEFPPEFIAPAELQHSLRFTEGERPTHSLVGRIQISDGDNEDSLSFRIEGIGGDEFNVTRTTVGRVTFFNLLYTYDSPLDRERIALYQLTIVAVDSISPVMTSNPSLQVNITIDDINDNAPQFMGDRMFFIPEGLEEGVFVGNVSASDADAGENARITYGIVDSTFDEKFTIDSTSGILRTSSFYKDLRFADNMRRLTVEVMAEDNGVVPLNNRSVFTVVVQHPIRFTNNTYTFELVENNDPLVTVGNVSASSSDPVSFYYRIESPGSDKFTIDRDTGKITVRESLDREISPMEMFTVAAVYSNHPDLSTAIVRIIVIDVNDNLPQFSSSYYTFSVTAGQRVAGTVFANDSDSGINSNITFSTPTTGTPLSVHNIGNNEAEIVIEDDIGQFGITLLATDGGGKVASTSVEVTIQQVSSSSDSTINSPVVVVAAIFCVAFLITTVILLVVAAFCFTGKCNKPNSRFV
ncbi:cadherin-8-like [Dysidea avara]|uniref:cadherin-8-like n=1 Tax=Dysidea avara TaxID=196820 RepID=UPI00332C2AB1